MVNLNSVAEALKDALGAYIWEEVSRDARPAVDSAIENLDLKELVLGALREIDIEDKVDNAVDALVANATETEANVRDLERRAARAEEELAEVRGELFKVQSLVSELLRPRPTLYARLLALFGIA